MKVMVTDKAALRLRRRLTRASLATAAAVAVTVALPAFALANAPNPQPTTTGTETLNADGSVTVALTGTWSWPGQGCAGRYGVGWAVDWWGITSSHTPNPSFSLSNATEVVAAGPSSKPWSSTALSTGTVTPVGAIAISTATPGGPGGPPPPPPGPGAPPPPPPPPGSSPSNGLYFHVAAYYAGEDTNLCAQTMPDGTPYGSWSATATYPSVNDIPAQLCVNMYDEHGTAGTSSGNPNDFSPTKDDDNSIQTNNFEPTAGGANCTASSSLIVLGGGGVTIT